MSKLYCVDCFNFITTTLYRHTVDKSIFNNSQKIRNAVNRDGRAVVFCCRKTGAFYLNNKRVYYLPGCVDYEAF
jgi:hypothetical protein